MHVRWTIKLLFAGALFVAPAFAQQTGSPYAGVVGSVVAVVAADCSRGDREGSGFFWGSNASVFTALHVISGCKSVIVKYADQGQFRVTDARYDVERDVAELFVSARPSAQVMPRVRASASVGEKLFVVGYPFAIATADAFPIEVTGATADKGTLGAVIPLQLRSAAKDIGLNLDTRVIRVAPGIQPGASGAPIVNAKGDLVGIGHGRLPEGAGAIGWITRAEYLDGLGTKMRRSITEIPDISAPYLSGQSLSAVTSSTANDGIQCGDMKIRFRWRRTLREILQTHNDPDGLKEITKNAQAVGLNIDSLVFRVWYEDQTGAYIATPADWQMNQQNNRCIVQPAGRRGGSVEIFGAGLPSDSAASHFADQVQDKEKDSKPRGMTISTNLRIFGNKNELLTNGALTNRRSYRGVDAATKDGALLTQTSFVRSNKALVVLGRTTLTVDEAMSYGNCELQQWQGESCARVKEASVETAKALLAAALATVPES